MLTFLLFVSLIVAAEAAHPNALNKVALPVRRSSAHASGEVDGPALLKSLQKTLNKYRSNITIPGASADALLRRRLATENLHDEVQTPDFDGQYYGPMEVGHGSTEQRFTVQFDTGSSDIFIPGPECSGDGGCPYSNRYNEGGIPQNRSTAVSYGSGFIEGDDYTDTISVAGLTVTDQGIISLTQASGFNTSDSDGLLGMGFTSIASSGFTTFFENLMAQNKVGSPEFSFYLGRAASNTDTHSSLCLGCRDPSRYTGTFTQVPVTKAGYWQIALNAVSVGGTTAGASTPGQAIIDTGTTLVLAPPAAAAAIFARIPDAFPIPLAGGYGDQTFFAYPCATPARYVPAIRFGGKAFAINPLDFNFGLLTSSFARLVGNETLAARLEAVEGAVKGARGAGEAVRGAGGAAVAVNGTGQADYDVLDNCVAAIVGTEVAPQGNVYVVGDAFLKNWYTVFNYEDAAGGPSVSFAKGV